MELVTLPDARHYGDKTRTSLLGRNVKPQFTSPNLLTNKIHTKEGMFYACGVKYYLHIKHYFSPPEPHPIAVDDATKRQSGKYPSCLSQLSYLYTYSGNPRKNLLHSKTLRSENPGQHKCTFNYIQLNYCTRVIVFIDIKSISADNNSSHE